MAAGASESLATARSARRDVLQELTHGLRAELVRRGEFLPSAWVEEAADDLHAGRLEGWVLAGDPPGGIGFFSRRARRAYVHVHITEGPEATARAARLLGSVVDRLPPDVGRADAGVTGLTDGEEDSLGRLVAHWPGYSILERRALVRSLTGAPEPAEQWDGTGLERRPVREVPLEAIAALDWSGFHGTPDESIVAETEAEDRQILSEILEGRLGRFLDQASIALFDPDGRAVGLLLTAEITPRRGAFLDLVVHPSLRRRGIGRLLLGFGLRATRGLGYSEAALWVTTTNLPALALYSSAGFQPERRAMIYRFVRS